MIEQQTQQEIQTWNPYELEKADEPTSATTSQKDEDKTLPNSTVNTVSNSGPL